MIRRETALYSHQARLIQPAVYTALVAVIQGGSLSALFGNSDAGT